MCEPTGRILIVDDDADIAGLVEEVLSREGYVVTVLREWNHRRVRAVIEHVRPDCVLLDGETPREFGTPWEDAAWMTALPAAVPGIMFSVNQGAINEAQRNESERSQAAGFSSVLPKPFDIDELVRVVTLAVSQSPFRPGPTG